MGLLGLIISHRHKCIFVKTRKTAGTSIERFFTTHLGPEDVIRGDEERNYRGRWNPGPELVAGRDPADLKLTIKQWRNGLRYYQHMPAWRIRARVGPAIWDEYFTFCFERDPWDKLVSFYWWRTRARAERPDFDTWVRTTPNLTAWPLYTRGDRLMVDFIGRYENLRDDLALVLDRIGLDAAPDLPFDKAGHRGPADGVMFSPDLDDWVRHQFRHEIELLGYDPHLPTRRPSSSVNPQPVRP